MAGGSRRTVGFGVVWPGYVYETGSHDETRGNNETRETCVAIESCFRQPWQSAAMGARMGKRKAAIAATAAITGADANGKRTEVGLCGDEDVVLQRRNEAIRAAASYAEIHVRRGHWLSLIHI